MAAFLFTISLTFTMSEQPQFVNMDINANITFKANLLNRCGTAWIPHVTTVNPNCDVYYYTRHELGHHDQWSALGPAFPIAYALTAGRAFEDYLDAAWIPPEGMTQNCPLLRVGERVEFMPCYRF